jgi:hypothetical protein
MVRLVGHDIGKNPVNGGAFSFQADDGLLGEKLHAKRLGCLPKGVGKLAVVHLAVVGIPPSPLEVVA